MPYGPSKWRIAFGIVISLLLHAAAVIFLRLPEARMAADSRTWLTQVEVRIVQPPPLPEPAVEPEPEPEIRRSPRIAAEPRTRQRRRESPAPRAAQQPAGEGTLILIPAEPGAGTGTGTGSGPTFDREAAKAAARDIAGELGPSPAQYRRTRDEKLAREIQNAARPNCKDGIPGGLLAPLYLMMDKKDSGCKW